MKQLIVLSGKGGTGKTTIASAFIELSKIHAFADCDVDAPNLHIIVAAKMAESSKTNYYGLGKATIDLSKCIGCGLCEKNCRFGAIKDKNVEVYDCEGCGVCAEICPVQAVSIKDYPSGSLMLYESETDVFSTAKLNIGSGNTGKLVTEVKRQLLNKAPDGEFAIIDGSPGIGCPVIASISGAYMVLIVAEPTISGIHDMKRIIDTTENFGIKYAVCINRFDINNDNTKVIEKYCNSFGIPVIGKIPFDQMVIEATNNYRSVVSFPESPSGKAIIDMWNKLYKNYICVES